jgi:hypothetical protein
MILFSLSLSLSRPVAITALPDSEAWTTEGGADISESKRLRLSSVQKMLPAVFSYKVP